VNDFGPFGGFGLFGVGFTIVFVVICVFIVFMIVMMASQFVRMGRQRAANAAAPEVQAQVRVIGKRVENLGQSMSGGMPALPSRHTVVVRMGDDTVYQRNLISFEQSGGERFEIEVPSDQYGLIAEGDTGTVTMKGTEFVSFARAIMR
jgi:Na+-transporting methylmalonyl-CoA/oxaloacetate decarboxylase gamma subunit